MTPCLGSQGSLFCTYDSKTLRLDADFFKYGEKNIRFRKCPAMCGRSNTSQKRYVWSTVFYMEEKISVFKNTRLRVKINYLV